MRFLFSSEKLLAEAIAHHGLTPAYSRPRFERWLALRRCWGLSPEPNFLLDVKAGRSPHLPEHVSLGSTNANGQTRLRSWSRSDLRQACLGVDSSLPQVGTP